MEITIKNNWNGEIPAKSYQEFKGMVDRELNQAAEGFVRIGYLLKVARDTNILHESGYKSVAEFALHEYGLSKDIVSRYIAINDRFSQDGYSDALASQYQGYGMAKLAEMLVLPDNLIDIIPAELTKTEIREIKKEYAQEQQITDIEVAIEAAEQEPVEKTEGERILYEYFKTNPEEYKNLPIDPKEVREYLKPDEKRLLICRLPGIGRCVMVLSEAETIPVTSMRGKTLQAWTWSELLNYIAGIAPEGDRKKLWSELYDMPYPDEPSETKTKKVEVIKPKEKPKVAPVQPVKVEVVPGVEATIEDEEKAFEAAEQERKKAEIMAVPEHTEEPESVENTEQEPITEESYKERMHALKIASRLKWNEINGCIAINEYQKAKEHIGELVNIIDQMEKLDNTPLIEEG